MDLALGSPLPVFSLPGVDGRTWSSADFAAPVLVVIVTCNHCPVAIAYEDRLIALAREHEAHASLVLINPNDATTHPEDSLEAMKVRATQKRFPFPYLRDESQAIARALHAKCTPDPFVFDASRKLVYAGRIDDSHRDPGKVRARDLARAIDATLAGRPVDFTPVPAMGCSIKWKS
jgi:peroxiredoxin